MTQTMPTKEEIEERKHFFKILQAFKNYEQDSKNRLERTRLYYERIPSRHKNLLAEEGFGDHLEKIKKCIETNYKLILQFIGKILCKYRVTHVLKTSQVTRIKNGIGMTRNWKGFAKI